MNKNLKVVYFSPTEGTKKIVKAVAESISPEYEEFDITLPKNRKNSLSFTKNDIVIIGMPTYGGRVPDLLLNFFDRFAGDNTLSVLIATYGNRDYDDILLEQYDIFTAKGFKAIAAAAFVAEHSFTDRLAGGRPDKDDLKTASNFGKAIAERLNDVQPLPVLTASSIPGSSSYTLNCNKPMMVGPETSDKCINCGICAENCPTGAIDATDFKTIDVAKCIRCNSCIKKCPVHAKAITAETYKSVQNWLIENYADKRREPEIFLA